ncbi:Hypothetical protein I5071_50960 [Sandaracinus amylolyticus]|nr:Hypothetical protein I5071_50960 [Sandaracinus amylolyticus]
MSQHSGSGAPERSAGDLGEYGAGPWAPDGPFATRRGVRADGTRVFLTTVTSGGSALEMDQLERVIALRDVLDPAWATQPLDLLVVDGRPVLVLADPAAASLDARSAGPIDVGAFLRIAIGCARSLAALHARALVHGDVRPASLLFDPESDRVWLARLHRCGPPSDAPQSGQDLPASMLPYVSPERTGRVPSGIDERSDLYSLGVTLYELLAGTVPFAAEDRMELVHAHVARRPPPLEERCEGVPAIVCTIVTTLLAKHPDDRYRTAAGLEADLVRCAEAWARGALEPFPLRSTESVERLRSADGLIGRAREVGALRAGLDRVTATHGTELVLLHGEAGVGKSAIVDALFRSLDGAGALIGAGKFDSHRRDVPYATLARALESLVRSVLARPEADVARWRAELARALGPAGGVLVDLIPGVARLLEIDGTITELPPQAAKQRVQAALLRFVGVLARPEHPLVLFLDDLQWLDADTLALLEPIATAGIGPLLLVGAYRDDELPDDHALHRVLASIGEHGGRVASVRIEPLDREAVRELVATMLGESGSDDIASRIHEEAGGNPFFAIQLLVALAEQRLLAFDRARSAWTLDDARIGDRRVGDNVVDLLLRKIARLPEDAQAALGQLACFGSEVSSRVAAIARGESEAELHLAIAPAMRAGLVARRGDGYVFLHDRIQEAAYARIDPGDRAGVHVALGRRLAEEAPELTHGELVFEIVDQLGRGAALIESREERERLASLALVAGRRARAATAYASAKRHLTLGDELLDDERWSRDYSLAFDLALLRAECELLTGERDAAGDRLSTLAGHARGIVDRSRVACLRIAFHAASGMHPLAIAVGLEYLAETGVEWNASPTPADVAHEMRRFWETLGPRKPRDLLQLPRLVDAEWLATLDVLLELSAPALFTNPMLYGLVVGRQANIGLEHGNSDATALAYAHLAVALGTQGQLEAAFALGRLAFDLVEERGFDRFRPRVFMLFGGYVASFHTNLRWCREIVERAVDAAARTGDLLFGGYAAFHLGTNLLVSAEPLGRADARILASLEQTIRARLPGLSHVIASQLELVRRLRGLPFDERFPTGDELLQVFEADREKGAIGHRVFQHWMFVMEERAIAGDFAAAVDATIRCEQQIAGISGLEQGEFRFWAALCHLAVCDGVEGAAAAHVAAARRYHSMLETCARHGVETWGCRSALVAAELARVERREWDAARAYDESIRLARQHAMFHVAGIASERASAFYAARGLETSSLAHLRRARESYARWGATVKVRELERAISSRAAPDDAPIARGADEAHLDIAAVVKLFRAVSGELVLPELVKKLVALALEHAGAERALLLVVDERGVLRIAASASTELEGAIARNESAPARADDVPMTIVDYVLRTYEMVVIDDARSAHPFAGDAYLERRACRSVLCLPMMVQGRPSGVLYLENNLAPQAYSSSRTAVLGLLVSQAAVALENARLYADLQRAQLYMGHAERLGRTGSFSLTPSTGETYWSEELFRLLEVEPPADVAKVRVHPEDLPMLSAIFGNTRLPEELSFEYRSVLPSGEVRHLAVVARDVSEPGAPQLFAGAARDVTEMRHAEEKLQQTQAALTDATRIASLGELAAAIAHEVNQPIAAIRLDAATCNRWLQAEVPNLDEARGAAGRIARAADRASEVVKRLRVLFTQSSGAHAPFDLADALSEVLALTRGHTRRAGVTVAVHLDDDLPKVAGDRVQVQQVLINLVTNAADATGARAPGSRDVSVTLRREGERVAVRVRDNGSGIAPADVRQIFDAFFTTKSAGMGMGLSISRTIVESHGGRLVAEANDDVGTTFSFSLPTS